MSANSDLHNLKMKPQQKKFEEGGEGNGGSATLSMCPNCHTKHIVGQSCPTFPVPQQEKCKHCGAPHENKQEINDFGCWQCGKKTSPHSEAWEGAFDKEFVDLSTDQKLWLKSGIHKINVYIFIRQLLHQTHEETVREMEGIIGKDEKREPASLRDLPSITRNNEKEVRNELRAEQRQRLAQYKNSKGGV